MSGVQRLQMLVLLRGIRMLEKLGHLLGLDHRRWISLRYYRNFQPPIYGHMGTKIFTQSMSAGAEEKKLKIWSSPDLDCKREP